LTLKVFRKEDLNILKYLDDDGYPIEPEHYIPIIPMALVNGALGIGTGFSTNVPCYNPKDIVKSLKMMLDGDDGEMVTLEPWYCGFNGKIELQANKYVSKGKWKRVAPTKIQVTELPIGFWTEDFKSMLEDMLCADNKQQQVLKNYESNYTHCKVDFTLQFMNSSVVDDLVVEGEDGVTKFDTMFKLVSPKLLGTSNMYLFNENGQITKYNTATDIIKAFYVIRLDAYQRRKDYLLQKLAHDIEVMKNKIRFIKSIINKELDVSVFKKSELESYLDEKEYMKVDDAFDYLIRMPIYNMTKDKVEELDADIIDKEKGYQDLSSKKVEDMWRDELEEFEIAYDKYIDARLSKMDAVVPAKKTIAKKKASSKP